MISYMAIPGITKAQITIDRIKKIVCDYYDLPVESIDNKTRDRSISVPRQICHYLALKHELGSAQYIGWEIGNRHHATVLHSRKSVNDMIETNRQFRQTIVEIERRL
jgi:chromosomal replication initiator protein